MNSRMQITSNVDSDNEQDTMQPLTKGLIVDSFQSSQDSVESLTCGEDHERLRSACDSKVHTFVLIDISALIVGITGILALLGYTLAATTLIAAAAVVFSCIRIIKRDASPWKIRTVFFDTGIGIAFAIGLMITYASIMWLM